MGFGTFVHHVGTFLLLISTALLIVSDVSAPVVDQLAIFKVDFGNDRYFNFGTFGWCLHDNGHYSCSKSHIGYDPASLIRGVSNGPDFSNAGRDTAKALTNVMVLHAVSTGLTFIAFLICLGTSCLGSFLASIISVISFIVTAVALICDFVGWSIIRHDVNKRSDGSTSAHYGPAIWCVLAAGILTLIAAVLVFVTCCAGRIRDRRHNHTRTKGYGNGV